MSPTPPPAGPRGRRPLDAPPLGAPPLDARPLDAPPLGAPARERQPGDGFLDCACGGRHWGLFGAAGLLVLRRDPVGRPAAAILQHRAVWSHEGGTWAVPGGALQPDETPLLGALREAAEEAAIASADIVVRGDFVVDHGTWRYTTVVADVAPGRLIEPRAADAESLDVRWVTVDQVPALPLLPAFAAAWPRLLTL